MTKAPMGLTASKVSTTPTLPITTSTSGTTSLPIPTATNETPTLVESSVTPPSSSSATSSAAPFHLTAVTVTSASSSATVAPANLTPQIVTYPGSCVRSSDYIAVDIPYKIVINSDLALYYTCYYACDHANDSASKQAHDSSDGIAGPNDSDTDSKTASTYDFDNASHRHCARDCQQ
ncbi:hypothetical protein LTR95_001296 [Oleoguttula sp. CCFEE 5521]